MTTTVTVKSRAWGASVKLSSPLQGGEGSDANYQDFDMGSNDERTFHLAEGQSITVSQPSEPPVAPSDEEVARPMSDFEEVADRPGDGA